MLNSSFIPDSGSNFAFEIHGNTLQDNAVKYLQIFTFLPTVYVTFAAITPL